MFRVNFLTQFIAIDLERSSNSLRFVSRRLAMRAFFKMKLLPFLDQLLHSLLFSGYASMSFLNCHSVGHRAWHRQSYFLNRLNNTTERSNRTGKIEKKDERKLERPITMCGAFNSNATRRKSSDYCSHNWAADGRQLLFWLCCWPTPTSSELCAVHKSRRPQRSRCIFPRVRSPTLAGGSGNNATLHLATGHYTCPNFPNIYSH